MPMSTCGRLVLVALCLTWTCAIRALAQASNPPSSHIRSEPSNHCNVSETQPAASSSCSPCKELQLIDGVAPPCDGVRGGGGASGLDIVGDPAAGDMPADGEAGVSSSSTASQPAPFGGPWNSRPKLTGRLVWAARATPRQRLYLRHQRDHLLPGDRQWRAAGHLPVRGPQ